MKTIEQLNNELDANIPRSAVKEREGAGRRTFSYLSTDYVIDRMNRVFGNLNWASDTVENKAVYEGQVNNKFTCHYIARVKVEAQHIDEQGRVVRTSHTGTGYGDGSDSSNPGKAHELAAKEAESDALKRACKNLGQSMGLALYDKDQTNVEEDAAPAKKAAPVSAPSPAASKPAQGPNRVMINQEINSYAKIINSKGSKSIAQLKEEMKAKYGTDEKEKLSDPQAMEFRDTLKAQASA